MSAASVAARETAPLGLSARASASPRSNFALASRRFFRQRLAVAGLVVTLGLILVAILAPWIAPTRYDVVDFTAVNRFPVGSIHLGRTPSATMSSAWSFTAFARR